VASVLAFDYFHIPPVFAFSPHTSQKRASARRSLPHDRTDRSSHGSD
jgi:hypothetical protein